MPLTLPSSPQKHYLTGMDWMIHALDHASRKQLGCGTAFQIAMELSAVIDCAALEKLLTDYCARFPFLNGKLARDFNLAPYWKRQPARPAFRLLRVSASSLEDAYQVLEAELNQPADQRELPFRVSCVETPQKTLIGFVFDHRLFDARGAEKFLHGLQSFYVAPGEAPESEFSPAPAYLDHWSEKFAAGKKVNRARLTQDQNSQTQLLKQPESLKGATNRFKMKTFNEEQTRAWFELAGPFMFLPYSLALSVQAVQALFAQKDVKDGQLVVSVTRDMRGGQGAEPAETFFNHLSFMFFSENSAKAQNFPVLFSNLKSQFYEQVKNKMPEALAEASLLMRILPLAVLSRVFQSQTYAPVSFSFASLGESAYQHPHFMEATVERLIHRPRIPPLPGLGIFFSQYRNRLNLTLSYLDRLITDTEADQLLDALSPS